MTTSRIANPVSRRAALAGLGTGGLALALTGPRSATAQEAATGHPIVGAWAMTNNPDGPNQATSFAIFHADGTYVECDPAIGVGIGAWLATGERTVDQTIIFQDNDLDPNTFAPGIGTFHIAVEVDETGDAITLVGDLEVLDADGNVMLNLPYTGRGARVVAQGPAAPGTPVATPSA